MKKIVVFIVLMCSLTDVYGQLPEGTLKQWAVSGGLMFGAGAAEGTREILTTRYWKFKETFPNANDQFWNPAISWTNKYKNGDPQQGPAYFGSTTFLAWTTDGKHLMSTSRNMFTVSAIVFIPLGGQKKKWYWYLLDAVVYSAMYQVGFHATHTVLFKGMNVR